MRGPAPGHLLSAWKWWLPALLTWGWLAAHAWVHEDAYITFRVIDHFWQGYGLRWNIDERVQVYTHPLWMWLNLGMFGLLQHIEATVFIASGLCVAWMCCIMARHWQAQPFLFWLYLTGLVASHAFRDYVFSGFEIPLLLLLATLLIHHLWQEEQQPSATWLAFLASLSVLTRPDTVLLYVPVMVAYVYHASWKGRLNILLAGGAPLLAWFGFATIYYGFPLPNTAYAKLPANYPLELYINSGLDYVQSLLFYSPLTALILLAGSIMSIWALTKDEKRPALLCMGCLLYGLYIVRVGGDYMAGRLWVLPAYIMWLSLLFVIKKPVAYRHIRAIIAIGITLVIVELWQSDSSDHYEHARMAYFPHIYDERAHYRIASCLFCPHAVPWQEREWGKQGLKYRQNAQEKKEAHDSVYVEGSVGEMGYAAGAKVLMVDFLALTDPLLARMDAIIEKAAYRRGIRPGHYPRMIPKGYLHARATGDLSRMEPGVREYYGHLRQLTHAPLWSQERWRTLLRVHRGEYDHLL